MNIEYAIIVKNKTRLEVLIERFNTRAQAQFYIERSGGNYHDYEAEHEQFQQSLSLVQRQLSSVIKNKMIDRSFLPSFLFNPQQVVIVIGQDGLVANTAKYVGDIPIVAVNPDSKRYDGVLLPFNPHNCIHGVEQVMKNEYRARWCSFAEAKLNDGQRLLAFNDLFIGVASHTSARYKISYQGKHEEHSSSGIVVSTQAGCTGWMSSIFNMAKGIKHFKKADSALSRPPALAADQLLFAVREPFSSKHSQTNIQMGLLDRNTPLIIESLMPNRGVIFSDGIESDFIHFNSGAIATIDTAREKVNLVLRD